MLTGETEHMETQCTIFANLKLFQNKSKIWMYKRPVLLSYISITYKIPLEEKKAIVFDHHHHHHQTLLMIINTVIYSKCFC